MLTCCHLPNNRILIKCDNTSGLSFERNNLFLARVTEKKLVELWGPRLKKCLLGWYMLSDCGFFDTTQFYPNMNHKKTPKFLSGREQFTTDEATADTEEHVSWDTLAKLHFQE